MRPRVVAEVMACSDDGATELGVVREPRAHGEDRHVGTVVAEDLERAVRQRRVARTVEGQGHRGDRRAALSDIVARRAQHRGTDCACAAEVVAADVRGAEADDGAEPVGLPGVAVEEGVGPSTGESFVEQAARPRPTAEARPPPISARRPTTGGSSGTGASWPNMLKVGWDHAVRPRAPASGPGVQVEVAIARALCDEVSTLVPVEVCDAHDGVEDVPAATDDLHAEGQRPRSVAGVQPQGSGAQRASTSLRRSPVCVARPAPRGGCDARVRMPCAPPPGPSRLVRLAG